MGRCYTFNSEAGQIQTKPGTDYGLKLALNTQQFDYTEELARGNQEAGIKFLVTYFLSF